MIIKRIFYLSMMIVLVALFAFSQENPKKEKDFKYMTADEKSEYITKLEKRFKKATANNMRTRANARSVILSGNQVTTIIYEYGSISKPNLTASQLIDLAWPKNPSKSMGYGYEFTPLLGAEVKDSKGVTTIKFSISWQKVAM